MKTLIKTTAFAGFAVSCVASPDPADISAEFTIPSMTDTNGELTLYTQTLDTTKEDGTL